MVPALRQVVNSTLGAHFDYETYESSLHRSIGPNCDISDIDQIVSTHRTASEHLILEAADAAAPKPPYKAQRINLVHVVLAATLLERFARAGDLQDINEAIEILEQVFQGYPDTWCEIDQLKWRHLKALAYLRRFERCGARLDVEKAILEMQTVVALTPPEHLYRSAFLNTLGDAFSERSRYRGSREDHEQAKSMHMEAFERTRQRCTHSLSHRLLRLANDYQDLGACANDSSALTNSALLSHWAHQFAVPTSPAAWGLRRDHGSFCVWTYYHDKTCPSQGEMLEAADALKPDHAELPCHLHVLGARRLARLVESFRVGALNPDEGSKAIIWFAQALESWPPFHPWRAYTLLLLGKIFIPRRQLCLEEAVHDHVGHPQARRLAANLLEASVSQDSVENLGTTDRLLDLYTTVEGQGQKMSHLVRDAVPRALSHGQVDKALEWLERGRCRGWGHLSHLRAPLHLLRLHSPELAQRITLVSRNLEQLTAARSRLRLGKEWLSWNREVQKREVEYWRQSHAHFELLTEARAYPGLDRFLLPSWSGLGALLPELGFIVTINVSARGCDAIVLSSNMDPTHIPLPSLTERQVQEWRQWLKTELVARRLLKRSTSLHSRTRPRSPVRRPSLPAVQDFGLLGILEGLWMRIVDPVLRSLHFLPSSGQTPRIWWCPTGPLSFLPIHAAGIYSVKGGPNLLDCSVSSYTPSITALKDQLRAFREQAHTDIGPRPIHGLLLVAQPNVPNAPSIEGTTKEVRSIQRRAEAYGIAGSTFTIGDDDETPKATVEGRMVTVSCIHLACHASQNLENPLQSHFLFKDGSLNLQTIIRKQLQHADLAYLSACETGTGDENLPDEAFHLAGGMLAAGFRRVVATMWSIDDNVAQVVADQFYGYLMPADTHISTGAGPLTGARSAYALRDAVMKVRDKLRGEDLCTELGTAGFDRSGGWGDNSDGATSMDYDSEDDFSEEELGDDSEGSDIGDDAEASMGDVREHTSGDYGMEYGSEDGSEASSDDGMECNSDIGLDAVQDDTTASDSGIEVEDESLDEDLENWLFTWVPFVHYGL